MPLEPHHYLFYIAGIRDFRIYTALHSIGDLLTSWPERIVYHQPFKEKKMTAQDGQIVDNSNLSIGDVLGEAWGRVSGSKLPFFLGMVAYMVTIIIYSVFTVLISTVIGETGGPIIGFILGVAMQLIIFVMIAGFIAMGIKRARGEQLTYSMVFSQFSNFVPVIITGILMVVLITIGYLLLVLPGIYLSVAYIMAIPVLIEKKISPWQALELSRKTVTGKWFSTFFIVLIMGIIVSISAIPLGIGLIWTIPMAYIVLGVIYLRLFESSNRAG